jgi:hypothetical protein
MNAFTNSFKLRSSGGKGRAATKRQRATSFYFM